MTYGATKDQWNAFVKLGITADLLPVVSNPNAVLSPLSSLTSFRKTPSRYNKSRQVGGIKDWTAYQATPQNIAKWSNEPDYGICVQTRRMRALDVDITDPSLADVVLTTIKCRFPNATIRTRPNSPKFLFPFFLEGDFFYRSIETDHGQIEFLAHGKQFVAVGTHESGSKYSLDIPNIITLTKEEFENLFSDLHGEYSNNTFEGSNRQRKPKCEPLDIQDDMPDRLTKKKLVLGIGRDDQLFIDCPFKHEHTTKGSIADTAYFPAGTRAYFNGHFHCFHAHCQHRTDEDFKFALGVDDFSCEDTNDIIPDPPDTLGTSNAPLNIEGLKPIHIPDGLIKDTVKWITDTALTPQPELALAAVLSFASAVFGRRYASFKDLRTNSYIISVAGPGSGKDHPRKQIKRLANAAALYQYIGQDEIRSAEGLITMLKSAPSCVMLLDEIGMLLRSIKSPKEAVHLKSVPKLLTTLYSSSPTKYRGGQYADEKKEVIEIESPNLCIYGTTTQEIYKQCINKEIINSGELSRFIIIPPKTEYPDRNYSDPDLDPPDAIVRGWSKFIPDFDNITIHASGIQPEVRKVPIESIRSDVQALMDEDYEKLRAFNAGSGQTTDPLWVRRGENALKIAMIFAICDNPDKPIMHKHHLDIGVQLMNNSLLFLQAMAQAGMTPLTEQRSIFKEDQETILAFIRSRKRTSKTDILRAFRHLKSREVDEIMINLKASGYVDLEETKNARGPKGVVYKPVKIAASSPPL